LWFRTYRALRTHLGIFRDFRSRVGGTDGTHSFEDDRRTLSWLLLVTVAAGWALSGELLAQAPRGTELWVTRVNGPASLNDALAVIAVDSAGNSYVTGFACGTVEYWVVPIELGDCET
jgi:hypothetical protein